MCWFFPLLRNLDYSVEVAKVHMFFTQVKVQILVEKKRLVKVEALIQLLYFRRSKKVQALKCTQILSLMDISTCHFCEKLIEAHIIII